GLRVTFIESAAGWLPHLVFKMDAVTDTLDGEALELKHRPSSYFAERRNLWIACDADEPGYEFIAESIGASQMFWGSDYPHYDHTPDWLEWVFKRTERLSDGDRRKVLGLNACEFWDLPVPVPDDTAAVAGA
ncbi:amidohydrolase family protein, partial [Pseudonocardia dioxanivorans]|uniref:amidohydrolase family protein n=1 Tax=Pseudonocardia dioxanivorans TaxID=240495 RepID=UPI001A9DEEAF